MIYVRKTEDNMMSILLEGTGNDIAEEYAQLTLRLQDKYPVVLDLVEEYLESELELRKEVLKNDKTDKHND